MKQLVIILLIASAFSCKKNEEVKIFPIEPSIEFKNLQFIKGNFQDTLKLDINFTDGDSDLGLDDNDEPNLFLYFSNLTGKVITNFNSPDKITYKDRKLIDTLPLFTTPFNCTNYQVQRNASNVAIDTVYFQLNRNYYNLIVNFYYKTPSSDWKEFIFPEKFIFPNCSIEGFNTRFLPYFNPTDRAQIKLISTQQGTLTYYMASQSFKTIFSNQKVKLKVYIKDRAKHLSNVIETSEIQF